MATVNISRDGTVTRPMSSGLEVCVNCGYKRGFHVTINTGTGKPMIILVCPDCGTKYDLDWPVNI
ncbi:hypothetical protein [Methanooceanicella nereidis]|uniref:hypothetical protein n=1 Tax=Methanooceanicella nereidis TaxID=2052831 RepID=UPI001E5DEA34|nr:hypothetical protein [Methanocella sp. CWC-04]